MPHARRRRAPALLVVPALVAAGVALLPLGYLAVRAGEDGLGGLVDVLLRERTLRLLLRSLALAVVVTAACVALGTATAWLTTRVALPGRRAWAVVVALPLAVPTYVAAYAYLSLAPGLQGFVPAAVVLTACCYPYVTLPVAAALTRLDPALEESARSLGAGAWETFRRVTWPQVRPAATAGGLLVALYVLSDFGAVSLLRFDTFTRVIYTSYTASFDRTPAAVLSVLLVVVTVAVVAAEARARGRATGAARVGGGAARATRLLRPGRRWTAPGTALLAAPVLLGAGVPLAAVAYWLSRGRSAGLDLAEVGEATASTLGAAGLGALVTTVLAVPVGVLAARYAGRLPRLLESASYAGHALPGVVVALALVFLSVRFLFPLYQELPVLVLAYAVLFLPLAVGAVRASVAQSPPVLEDVARSLGSRPAAVLARVTLPLAGPGVLAGAALVFLTCMKELPATLLLRPTGFDTLATRLWSETQVGAYAAAAPHAALLVLLAAVPTWLLGRRTAALASGGER